MVPISIRMHKKKAGKLQTGNTFPKQYWLAVNGKPKRYASGVPYAAVFEIFYVKVDQVTMYYIGPGNW